MDWQYFENTKLTNCHELDNQKQMDLKENLKIENFLLEFCRNILQQNKEKMAFRKNLQRTTSKAFLQNGIENYRNWKRMHGAHNSGLLKIMWFVERAWMCPFLSNLGDSDHHFSYKSTHLIIIQKKQIGNFFTDPFIYS